MIKWLIPVAVASAAVIYSCAPSKAYTPRHCQALSPFIATCGGMATAPGALILSVTPKAEDDSPEGLVARRAWTERCKPHIITDRYGMGRWMYAEDGCEFGP